LRLLSVHRASRLMLCRKHPNDLDYQRDLSVSYDRMGDLYVRMGDGGAAREAFQKSLEIFKKLSEGEPARADYQRDLFVSYYKLGTADPARGRSFFEKSLQILLQLEAAGRLDPADRPYIDNLRQLANS
ncbi:MAG: tetratricopeptide repeat protein, partial [Planctomycetaceae bacterium]